MEEKTPVVWEEVRAMRTVIWVYTLTPTKKRRKHKTYHYPDTGWKPVGCQYLGLIISSVNPKYYSMVHLKSGYTISKSLWKKNPHTATLLLLAESLPIPWHRGVREIKKIPVEVGKQLFDLVG